jgi:hypothetical protein
MTAAKRASHVLSVGEVDSFYPVVSFLAFLSGGCFGLYYGWRSGLARQDDAI